MATFALENAASDRYLVVAEDDIVEELRVRKAGTRSELRVGNLAFGPESLGEPRRAREIGKGLGNGFLDWDSGSWTDVGVFDLDFGVLN